MICKRTVYSYCKDDISLIENYEQALNDQTQVWHCHHRRETDDLLSKDELINMDLYFKVSASELIFLTPYDHVSLHKIGEIKTEEHRKNISESCKQWHKEHPDANKGENNPMFGKTAPIRGKHKVWDNKELNKYHFEF